MHSKNNFFTPLRRIETQRKIACSTMVLSLEWNLFLIMKKVGTCRKEKV